MTTHKRYTQADIDDALRRVDQGQPYSVAARFTGVPRKTIRDHDKRRTHDANSAV